MRAPVDCEPLTAMAPDQAPEAVQAVALPDDHVKVELPRLLIVVGEAARVTVGAGRWQRRTSALPPEGVQLWASLALSVKVAD